MTESSSAKPVRFIARWDLDKTYLRTDFDTLRDLIRTAVERPDLKRSVPGAAALLRELSSTGARIHILSGSPRQMRGRLEEKLRIDRVRYDDLTLKPNLGNMMRLRFRALRDQLGYKLPVLLNARVRDQALGSDDQPACEALVGDDAEADAFVYSLYADILAGNVDAKQLARIASAGRLYGDQANAIVQAAGRIQNAKVVERILIHLDRQTSPSQFRSFGGRVVPFYNYLQAAFVLADDGRLDGAAVLRIASEFVRLHRFTSDTLARSYLDLMKRGHAHSELYQSLSEAREAGFGKVPAAVLDHVSRMIDLIGEYTKNPPEPPEPAAEQPDYVELARRHRGGRNRRQPRA